MSDYLNAADLEAIVRDISTEQHFRDRNAEWKETRRLVFRDRPVTIPGIEMETEYRTAALLDAADKYTARFLGAPFTVNVSAQGPGPKAAEKAQAMENYDYRLLNRWWAAGLFTGAIHDMAGVTGEGWVHLTLNRNLLPVMPLPADGEDPEAYLKRNADLWKEFTDGEEPDLLQLEPIREPETIYYNPDRSLIFSRMMVPLAPLQRQYAQAGAGGLTGKPGKGKGIEDSDGLYEVTTIEGSVYPEGPNSAIYGKTALMYIVETDDYIYHLIEDAKGVQNAAPKIQLLGCYKNVFGAPGFVWVHARKTNHVSSKHSVHPLTHAAIAIAPNLNIMGTIVYSGGIYGEMSRISLEALPGPEAALERANNKNLEIELLGNRVSKAPDGYRFVQPNIGVNKDTLQAFASLEQKMATDAYPPVLGQPEQAQATSGYQQSVMTGTVASVLEPPLANIASMLNQLLRLKDTAIKTLGYPVTFRNFSPTDEMGPVARDVMDAITINPDDIVDVDRSVTFDSLTQYARTAKIELGRELLGEGRITEDMFMRDYMGVDDPIRIKKQRLIEKAQTIAEEAALKAAAAKFNDLMAPVGQQAMAQSGLTPFTGGGAASPSAPNPQGGVSVSNGAGGSVPVAPAPASPQAELSMAGGSPGSMG